MDATLHVSKSIIILFLWGPLINATILRIGHFLLTPNSKYITSLENIGLQPTPLSASLHGIIKEFIA